MLYSLTLVNKFSLIIRKIIIAILNVNLHNCTVDLFSVPIAIEER